MEFVTAHEALQSILAEVDHAKEGPRCVKYAWVVRVFRLVEAGDVQRTKVANRLAVTVPVGQVLVEPGRRHVPVVREIPLVGQVDLLRLERLQPRITSGSAPRARLRIVGNYVGPVEIEVHEIVGAHVVHTRPRHRLRHAGT